MFARIELHGWRQFGEIDITFHDRLTVLTGANGAGKTTLLNILNRHAGWNLQFLATPQLTRRGVFRYFTGLWQGGFDFDDVPRPTLAAIGSIYYDSGNVATLQVPQSDTSSYHVQISNQEAVPGLFIPSHRPVNTYQAVQNIPTVVQTHTQLFEAYLNELRMRYNPGRQVVQYSPMYRMKEALIALGTFGYGNDVVQGNPEYVRIFEQFNEILRIVLPPSLGFQRITVRLPEVVLETTTGDFSLDSVSGGITSIIDMAWQLHIKGQDESEFAVMIDEPENHLHPTMQRSLLSDMIEAFPSCQFIVATHNPFIVTSVPDSNVYVLDYDEERHVNSRLLEAVDRTGTSNDILRDVLGVDMVIPEWVETRLTSIVAKYTSLVADDPNRLREMRRELEELGLRGLFPEAATGVANNISGRDD